MQEALDRIRRAVSDDALKNAGLAREAGVNPDVLIGVHSPGWNPQTNTVRALIGALDRIAARLAA
jgi:hypothetical protein